MHGDACLMCFMAWKISQVRCRVQKGFGLAEFTIYLVRLLGNLLGPYLPGCLWQSHTDIQSLTCKQTWHRIHKVFYVEKPPIKKEGPHVSLNADHLLEELLLLLSASHLSSPLDMLKKLNPE